MSKVTIYLEVDLHGFINLTPYHRKKLNLTDLIQNNMRIFALIVSIITILITALPVLRVSYWWVRIWDFPRLQIAFLCLLSLILLLLYLEKSRKKTVLLVLVVLAFSYQAFYMIPYTPVYPVQAETYKGEENKSSFSVLEANVKMDNKEVKEFLKMVGQSKPHILVITEPNKWWDDETRQLSKQFPYFLKKPLGNTYGMILYSKFLLKAQEINFLVDDDIPSFYTKVVLPDGQDFDLYTLHPKPPKPGTATYDRDTEILLIGRRIKKTGRPAMVVGDLNDVGWSYTSSLFQRYSQMLDPRIGRGLYNTYSVSLPLFRYPLDHFFYSKHFGFVSLKKLDPIGSDHFPMLLKVNLQRDKNYEENLPKPDKGDKEEVKETINQEDR